MDVVDLVFLYSVPPPPPPPPPDGGEEGGEGEQGEQGVQGEEGEEDLGDIMDDEEEDEENGGHDEEDGMWEEKFKTHSDSKPYGIYIHTWHVYSMDLISVMYDIILLSVGRSQCCLYGYLVSGGGACVRHS